MAPALLCAHLVGADLMIIWLCRDASERQVETAVARGATTVCEVSRACGAGSDCGACQHRLAALIEDARSVVCASGEMP